MKSGELAKETGVSADTLHHYEKLGLLTPLSKQDNGYRHYDSNAVQRVQLIQKALRLGFSLSELAPFLKERDSGGAPCKSVKRLAEAKLKEIDERLEALKQLRAHFAAMISEWNAVLETTGADKPSHLLEKLPDLPVTASTKRKGLARSKK